MLILLIISREQTKKLEVLNIEFRTLRNGQIRQKVDILDKDLKSLKVVISDRDKTVDERINKIEDKVESSYFSVGLMNGKMISLEKENVSLKENLVYLQSQSMRNNLIFQIFRKIIMNQAIQLKQS